MKRKNLSKKKRLKKLLTTSATGLVLLSTLTQPVVSLANTVEETKESEKKTVSSNEQSPIENPVNALENTISSSSNTEGTVEKSNQTVETKESEVKKQQEVEKTKESEEKTQQEVQGRAVTTDVIQYLMETKIYTDAMLTTVRPTLMQADIDSVRSETQKLPDGETKTQYLSKLDQAYNQLQEITLRSDVGETFATINVTPNKLILRTTGKRPSSYGTFMVSQLKIIRGGREILRRDIRANDNLSNEQLEYTLQNGDQVEIFIHDPRNGVLTNHDKLNPNNNNNSVLNFLASYTIIDGLLVLQDKYNEIVNTVRNLYEDEAQTIVKKTLEQSTIDSAREKVNALPNGEEKTALLAKVDEAFNGLQEIQLRGIEDYLFSRVTVTKGKLVVRTQKGYPHYRLDGIYSSIQVTRDEETVYSKEYNGKTNYPASQDEVNLQNGDIVTIMKIEANQKRFIVNHPELKPNENGNYTYVVQDGLLIEASRKVQLDAQNAVKELYEDEAQTIVKKTLEQSTIDSAREKVNALPNGEEKTALLAKVDEAFNGLQEIQLRGIEDYLFSRVTVTKGKLVVRTQKGYPHYRLDGIYSSIQVTRDEETVYSKEYNGKTNYPASQDEVNLQNGDIVTIMKIEANQKRFIVNHPELKPNENGNYTYVVQDGLLIAVSDKGLKEAQLAVKGLYEDEAQTIVKKDLLQATIDEAHEKVNALPDSKEKTKLLAKVDEAFNGLQEIQLRGVEDFLFSRVTVTKGKLVVRTQKGYPHYHLDGIYSSIQVTRDEETVYSKEYNGKTNYPASQDEVNLQNGDIVTIMKIEANQKRFIVNHPELKPNENGNYAYLVQDGLLVDQSAAYTAANTSVNNLFEGEEPKGTNTQEQIDDARTKVNALLDSPLKQQLLAKVEQAQKLFDSLVGSLTVEDFQLLGSERYIRGTFSGNVDYLRLEVNGVSYAKSTVKGESFQYYAVDKIKSPTDQVFLVGYNKDNRQVDRQQVNILPVQGTLSEVSFTLNSSNRYIEGSYTGNVAHIRLEVNGELKAKSGVSGNNFRYYAVDKIKNITDQVSLIAYDQNGNEIDRKEVTIHNALVGTIQTNSYVLGNSDRYIHGTYTGDVAHIRLEVNGELKAKSGVSGNKFRYYAVDKIDNMNDKVSIIAYDAKGNELDKQPVTIETARKGTITPNEYKLGSGNNYLRGEYSGDVHALRLEVNGKLFARSVPGNSPFKYYVVDKIKNLTDEVYLIAYDNADIEIAREKVDVIKEQTIHTTERPTGTLNAGINMGNGHDRQDIGIQLEKGSKIKIKQVNPNYNENMNLRLLANGSNKESSISFGKNEMTLEAKDLTVPFVYTPYHAANMEKPVIQVTIEGTYRKLPVFDLTTEQSEFNQTWALTNGYALVKGNRFQTLFPEQNKTQAINSNLRSIIQMYDNDILGQYDEWIGLSPDASDPTHKSSPRRYFFKADANGVGALYYGGAWSAQTSSSADAWLTDGWGVLHEIGHGYQGHFMSKGMNSGEVWNNIYGVLYQYKKLGKEEADRTGWLYDRNKQRVEQQVRESILQVNPNYQTIGLRNQLLVLSNLIDKAGNEGFKNFYTKYRELASQQGFNANNYPLPDLLVNYLGETNKYDFSPVLNAWGLTVKRETKQQVKEQNYTPVAHLAQVVPNEKLSEAIDQFTQENRLSSVLSLVTNDELKAMNLTSEVTLNFTDEDLFDGVKLRIMDDDTLYQEVTLNQGEVMLENIPNGVYSLELQTDTGYLKKPYMFVKENGTINISLTSYLKEATEAVANLFQKNSETKVKENIMQKNIDDAKALVTALPESEGKQQLLEKVERAHQNLQEFTFRGLGNWTFATLNIAGNTATIRTNQGTPHSYFSNRYASISIIRDGQTMFEKEYIGNQNYPKAEDTVELQEGDVVTMTHREANDTRLAVNHGNLKHNTQGNYQYTVTNGLLVLNR